MSKKDIVKHQFDKGVSGNPKGRPRKWVSTLTDQGYKKSEVQDCIMAMMSMTLIELEQTKQNPNATAMELTISGAILKGISKGSLYSMEVLMDRVYGKPKESVDNTIQMKDITHVTKWSD